MNFQLAETSYIPGKGKVWYLDASHIFHFHPVFRNYRLLFFHVNKKAYLSPLFIHEIKRPMLLYFISGIRKVFIIFLTLLFMVSGCIAPKNIETRIDEKNKEIIEVHLPSLTYLYKLHFMIYESKELTRNWTYVYKSDDAIDKIKLRKIHSIDYPELEMKLRELKKEWSLKEQLIFNTTTKKIEALFDKEKSIMNTLNSYESYEDVMIVFQIDTEFERGEDSITTITEEILRKLTELIEIREKKLKKLLGA
jgi:hypothetical protein